MLITSMVHFSYSALGSSVVLLSQGDSTACHPTGCRFLKTLLQSVIPRDAASDQYGSTPQTDFLPGLDRVLRPIAGPYAEIASRIFTYWSAKNTRGAV
jgi:hypothetical protein